MARLKLTTGKYCEDDSNQPEPAAMRALSMDCMSTTIDLVASIEADLDCLKRMGRLLGNNAYHAGDLLNALFNGCYTLAKESFMRTFRASPPCVDENRWYSFAEFLAFMYEYLEDGRLSEWLCHFWEECDMGFSCPYVESLFHLFCPEAGEFFDEIKLRETIIEIALTVDFSYPLRSACYTLETDLPGSVIVNQVLEEADVMLKDMNHNMQWKRVGKLITQWARNNKALQPARSSQTELTEEDIIKQWRDKCFELSAPAMAYWDKKIMQHPYKYIWDAAELVNPHMMKHLAESNESFDVNALRRRVLPLVGTLIDDNLLAHMMDELPAYKAAAIKLENYGLFADYWLPSLQAIVEFWRPQHKKFPSWRKFAHACFLIRTSSASVDRACSLLKGLCDDENVVIFNADATRGRLMLRFNHLQTRPRKFRKDVQMFGDSYIDDEINEDADLEEIFL